ncbi:unnamed protein product [Danaus chrysippus]|uniref:(African queen) hypothetical protein n=1 Tax=Danaus chrysippus TaxID=151541 RepID=A0A8J2QYG6_9NEOP|nr:unnamed protein product [Danaus chrysippus]
MSVSVEDVSSPLSEGQSSVLDDETKSEAENKSEDVEAGQKSEPTTPKPHPMAFTIDFGQAKQFDNRRLEELAKKSQARHQRVQSMSAGQSRQSPISHRPPMSGKLPRKAQGYNSEGYFSSDQEDSGVSSSVKLRSSPLAADRPKITSPITNRLIRSPVNESKLMSKSPIVDSIMSRSDNYTHTLNLPLKNANSSYLKDVHRSPSYGNINCNKLPMDIIDASPEGAMLTDISSPELDILTPDNGLSTPEHSKSPLRKSRASSATPDLLFRKCPQKSEPLYIDDEVDGESNHSSTGTYTIECDNYTEEQKARMSIDRTFGVEQPISVPDTLTCTSVDRDPEIIFDFPNPRVITKEPRRDVCLRNPVTSKADNVQNKISNDRNVLEISCCYESPNDDLALQTSKQIKSTRSYLEKIKNRVRTITEKTFSKSPPKYEEDADLGTFTSVTTSGVLSSKYPIKVEMPSRRRCSLTKSEIDRTDYIHRLSRESSVPVNLPSNKNILEDTKFESTALKNAQKALKDDVNLTSDPLVGKLSYLSLNRCKGDKTWIQDWADSVKKYNNNVLPDEADLNTTFSIEDRPPISPRLIPTKPRSPHGTPTKIPSPVGTLLHRRTPDLIPPQDTESYLVKTQNAITNLQAKLHSTKNTYIPNQLTTSLVSEKTLVSRLPLSQLSRSNSLNYRLRRKETSGGSSPLRSPGHYVITGSAKVPETNKILINSATRSLEQDTRHDSNMNSPCSERGLLSNSSDDKTLSHTPYDVHTTPNRKTHTRHRSFDGKNPIEYFPSDINNANQNVTLKHVLKNNAIDSKTHRIDPTRCQDTKKTHIRVLTDGKKPYTSIKRSSSFSTVNRNNNLDPRFTSRRSSGQSEEYKDYSDESDNGSFAKTQDVRLKRPLHRDRMDYDVKSIVPSNSPRCPNTPEMQRKFGPGLVRASVRHKDQNTRMSEPPMSREEKKPVNHQSRRITEPTRQAVLNRLTKSRSSTREVHTKPQEKGQKKPSHRSTSGLASKEVEFSNWKKRSSYDPMKSAQEGRKKQQMVRKQEYNKDDLSSPSHSSPVHRSQSFHNHMLDYSSEEETPVEMITSTHSDMLGLDLRRELVVSYQVNPPQEKIKRREQKTKKDIQDLSDKRKTFIVDSDTNSTTNGSSPRTSVFSHKSDTEDSGPESAPVMRQGRKIQQKQRYSGDFSMSSSTTSVSKKPKESIQPRYLDISKYKSENSPKNFLRRDPSKTYIGVLNNSDKKEISKGSAQHYEMEQKKQELEKWKRRASYDPRKAAAADRGSRNTSNVLRSQSFHGPVLSPSVRYQPQPINETYDASSDNDF